MIFSSVLWPPVGSIFGRARSHCFLLLIVVIQLRQARRDCSSVRSVVPSGATSNVGPCWMTFSLVWHCLNVPSSGIQGDHSWVTWQRRKRDGMSDTCIRNQELQEGVKWMLIM